MSRTRKGSKPPGLEYWGPRPGNKHGKVPGPGVKKITHGKERAAAKQQIHKEAQSDG